MTVTITTTIVYNSHEYHVSNRSTMPLVMLAIVVMTTIMAMIYAGTRTHTHTHVAVQHRRFALGRAAPLVRGGSGAGSGRSCSVKGAEVGAAPLTALAVGPAPNSYE